MTIEDNLKDFIIDRYGSLLAFSSSINFPHSTLVGILKRGVHNSSINNIIKICSALNLSVEALADDKIVEVKADKKNDTIEIKNLITRMKTEIKNHDVVTLNGKKLDNNEVNEMIHFMDFYLQYKQDLSKK